MTHKIVAFYTFENAVFCRDVGFIDTVGVFFLNDLCLSQFELFLVLIFVEERIIGGGGAGGGAGMSVVHCRPIRRGGRIG
jgi:hypothetical protein